MKFNIGDKVIFYKDEYTTKRNFTVTFQMDRALREGLTLRVRSVHTYIDPYFVTCDHKTFSTVFPFDPRDLKLAEEKANLLCTQDINLASFDPSNPDYYKSNSIEAIDYIKAHKLNFSLGNVVKYITRAGKKDTHKHLEDLEKAMWYLEDEIKEIKKGPERANIRSSDELDG